MFGIAFTVWGAWIGAQPFNDNSFMTHLATGRILAAGSYPDGDVYSFTAEGEPWVIQSWLVSTVYGSLEQLLGSAGIHLFMVGLTAALGALVWTLTRPAGTLIPRIAIAGLVLGVGATMWSERPLLVGLLGIALTLLVAEDRLDPRWLVPMMWLWANSHGSFPLGVAVLVVFAAGHWLDGESRPPELRALPWALLGVGLAVIGPLGPDVLLFPVDLLSRSDVLAEIVEWQSPSFRDLPMQLFLMEAALAVFVLVRRPSWRAALPLVVFLGAALVATRNVAVAGIVFIPGLAHGTAGLGTLSGDRRSPLTAGAFALLACPLVLLAWSSTLGSGWRLGGYPTAAVAWMEQEGLHTPSINLAHQDYVGNFLEATYGADAGTLIDDRYDMFPLEVIRDYRVLSEARAGWDTVLRDRDVDLVLWGSTEPLTRILVESEQWRMLWVDDAWVVACRRGSDACPGASVTTSDLEPR